MAKKKFNDHERYAVWITHGEKCYLCGERLICTETEIDHIIPESIGKNVARFDQLKIDYKLGGDFNVNSYENWMPCCRKCNREKSDIILENSLKLQILLQNARSKVARAKEAERKSRTDRKLSISINTIKAANTDGTLSKTDVSALRAIVDYQEKSRKGENGDNLMLVMPGVFASKYESNIILTNEDGVLIDFDNFEIKGKSSNLSDEDLDDLIKDELDYIDISCARFDEGVYSESKRIARSIKNLLHDDRAATSLLRARGTKNIEFYDSSLEMSAANEFPEFSLIQISLNSRDAGQGPTAFFAPLDDAISKRMVNFVEWWNAPVFKDINNRLMTRRQLVLAMSDMASGLDNAQAAQDHIVGLTKGHSLGLWASDGSEHWLLGDAAQHAVRQIAHELKKSLDPNFEQRHQRSGGVFVGGMSLTKLEDAPLEIQMAVEAKKLPKVGRNEKCPCGSGKKSKKCHGPYQ
jgi:5-methylcytosine-specific restriction endonuclease McrA